MSCFYPLDAWQARPGLKPQFKYRAGWIKLTLPCGQCIGCRLERSRQWAIRCVHESSLHEQNCFITLTYADNPLSLRKSDFQKFMKRLRKALSPLKIRYFMCGEYGEQFDRPHFHACIFGWRPTDLEPVSARDGVVLYKSQFLADIWSFGFTTVGDVSFESAAYVARYINKKVTGTSAHEHYEFVDEHGEVIDRLPEYCDMSRRPGIASGWYDLYKSDLDKDFLTLRGNKMRPPRFYDRLLHAADPEKLAAKKEVRKVKALQHSADNSFARLETKRRIKERKITQLKRGFNHDL